MHITLRSVRVRGTQVPPSRDTVPPPPAPYPAVSPGEKRPPDSGPPVHPSRLALLAACCAVALVGCPPPPVLGFPGPLPIHRWDTTFDNGAPITIYYPDTSPPQKQIPLVIFTAGWNQPRGGYLGYGEELAQWGYVAIIRAYPDPSFWGIGIDTVELQIQQTSDLIDWCDAENARQDSPLYGMVDTTRVAAAGHSLGADISGAAAVRDPRIGAIVNLDAITVAANSTNAETIAAQLGGLSIPILLIGSDKGVICSGPRGPNALPLFDIANPPTEEVIIHGAAHIDFIEQSQGINVLGQIICGGGTTNKNEVRAIASRYMISWLNVYLQHRNQFRAYFDGPYSQQDVAQGKVSIRSKF